MKHIVMYSGGMGSFLTAWRVSKSVPKEDMILLFADTLYEDKDLYRFLDETSKAIGVPITRIAEGRDIWQVFEDERFLGNSRVDPCSKILKREFLDGWIEENFKPDECVLYFGIDWTEIHRYERLKVRKAPYQCEAPLCFPPFPDKQEGTRLLRELGIELPDLYKEGFSHNNCGGRCVKAGISQWALLYKRRPASYLECEENEQRLIAKLGPHSILKEVVNSEKKNLTLRQLRERIDAGKYTEEFDFGGCGCAVDA